MSIRDLKIWKTRIGAILIAAATAFVLSNILVATHAAKYGEGPHEHNGKACVLSIAAPGAHKVIETATFVLVAILAVFQVSENISETNRARVRVRAARPRGPPSL